MYDLISSATVALASVFLLINIASYFNAQLSTFDIGGAFLHASFGPEDPTTFIRINKEVTDIWILQDPSAAPYVDRNGTLLLQLDKFIYGLKQSPMKFQEHLTNVLTNQLGYRKLNNDECLFIRHSPAGFSILSLHVDDILQVSTSPTLFEELKAGLIAVYKDVTAHQHATSYLGMGIARSPDGKEIKLTQEGLAKRLVDKYPKRDDDKAKYPTPAAEDLFDTESPETEILLDSVQKKEFLSLIMTLMYLARLTRPDIILATTYLACRTHCPTVKDGRSLERIIRYLDRTSKDGVTINCTDLQLHCSCDASYGVHTPDVNAKGHTGFLVGFGKNFSYIHARSGKQKVASTSSTDAEIVAMVDAIKLSVWLRDILAELDVTDLQQIVLQQDNMSAIQLVTEKPALKRTRHLCGD
jgi:hypothetical protein